MAELDVHTISSVVLQKVVFYKRVFGKVNNFIVLHGFS